MYVDSLDEERILKISFFSPAEGYVAFDKWIGFTQDSGRTFVRKYVTISNVDFNNYLVNLTFGFILEGVKAFDADNIIVYGHYGFGPSILYSTNGGDTYKLIFHTGFNPQRYYSSVTDMVFPKNGNVGYAVDLDRILKTVDRGKTWSVIKSGVDEFNRLIYVDADNIFAFNTEYNKNKLLNTGDGGKTWQEVPTPAGRLYYASFITPSKGWISIENNDKRSIYYTPDGGATWSLKNNPDINPFIGINIKFVNDSVGFGLNKTGSIFKTTDGGSFWEKLSGDEGYLAAAYSLDELSLWDEKQLWAGGWHGALMLSTNGGGTPVPAANFITDTTGSYATGKVNLVNYSKQGYTYQWYLNSTLISEAFHASYQHDVNRTSDTIALVVSNGMADDTLIRIQNFVVPGVPSLTSFSPSAGGSGTVVRIRGSNLEKTVSVSFGNVPAASFTILSSSEIEAVVGEGATGSIVVKDIYHTATIGKFTYTNLNASPAPIINSISPTVGPAGTPVTITGTSFNPTPGNNIVYFGAVRAKVTAASSTQITCIVPAGTSFAPITLLNTGTHLSGASTTPFLLTFPKGGNFTLNSFTQKMTFQPENGAFSFSDVSAVDVDIDGKPDIISNQNLSKNSIVAYRNTSTPGNFSFEEKKVITNTYASRFTFNDIDGDGKQDLIVAGNTSYVIFSRNNSSPGNVVFDPAISLPLATDNRSNTTLAVGDIDGDGRPDIITGDFSGPSISVIRNTSTPGIPSFAAAERFDVSGSSGFIAIGDLNGDNKKEIIICKTENINGIIFSYLENTSTPGKVTFGKLTDIVAPEVSRGEINILDFDNDNQLDVIMGTVVFRNTTVNGVISFAPPVNLGGSKTGVIAANLNGDDKPDLISTGVLIRNMSTPGKIAADPGVQVLSSREATSAVDFDLDGRTDIVNSGSHAITVYGNNFPSELPKTVCEGWTTTIETDLYGNTYQWQLDKGDGFKDIQADDTSYTGINTQVLYFYRVPVTAIGYKLRCKVDGNYSSVVIIKQVRQKKIPHVEITADKTNICHGTMVTFIADTSGMGYDGYLEWKYNTNSLALEDTIYQPNYLKDGDRVWAVLHSSDLCSEDIQRDTSNIITMSVKGDEPGINIHRENPGVICPGTATTFYAETFYAGDSYTIQWMLNGTNVGDNKDSIVLYDLKDLDEIQASLTVAATSCSGPQTVYSGAGRVSVSSVRNPDVVIQASKAEICPGETITFTAKNKKYDNSVYKWMIDGSEVGTNSDTLITANVRDGSNIKVIYTAVNECGAPLMSESNTLIIKVNPVIVASVTIASSATEVCKGSDIIFTATAVNGGTAPKYSWLVNSEKTGAITSEYHTNTLNNGDEVSVRMNSNAVCADTVGVISNAIRIRVNEMTDPTLEIFGDTLVKSGESVILTATLANAAGQGMLQWQEKKTAGGWHDIPGAVGAELTYAPETSGDKVRCFYSTSDICSIVNELKSNEITFVISPVTSGREAGARLYPNPATNEFVLDSIDLSEDFVRLEITGMNGISKLITKNIKGLTKVQIPVYMLSKGRYIVVLINSNGERKIIRFIKL
ncbi:MAG: FG-GAP-like repeat-containing protein [Chitinophagaceae bacterium]|nr:FG-GAP-like repeat-containing protein [Chitinophagaceae bacterium]